MFKKNDTGGIGETSFISFYCNFFFDIVVSQKDFAPPVGLHIFHKLFIGFVVYAFDRKQTPILNIRINAHAHKR